MNTTLFVWKTHKKSQSISSIHPLRPRSRACWRNAAGDKVGTAWPVEQPNVTERSSKIDPLGLGWWKNLRESEFSRKNGWQMKQRLEILISLVEVMWIERIWIWNHGFRFDSSEGMLPKQRTHPIIPRINFLPPVKFCKNRSWMSWLKLMPKSHQNDRSLYFHPSIPIFNTWRGSYD